jgi:hypothetical protein
MTDGPRLREWTVSHDPLLLHPANAVVDLYQGNAIRSRSPDTLHEKRRSGVTAGRECFSNPEPLSFGKATSSGWWAWRGATYSAWRADEVAEEWQLESLGDAGQRTIAV